MRVVGRSREESEYGSRTEKKMSSVTKSIGEYGIEWM